jgi:hypothetical protein
VDRLIKYRWKLQKIEEDSLQNIESEGMGSIAHLKRKQKQEILF